MKAGVRGGKAAERPRFGFTDEELATLPTVYRDDLLKDQVVLVSGGGSASARALPFCARGSAPRSSFAGRTQQRLTSACDAIERLVGRRPMDVSMSIREPEQVEMLFGRIYAEYGRLDHLINNAGGQFPQDAIDFSRKGWKPSSTSI